MSEDWLADDAFVDPDDPAAVERERRRREREERRRRREEGDEAPQERRLRRRKQEPEAEPIPAPRPEPPPPAPVPGEDWEDEPRAGPPGDEPIAAGSGGDAIYSGDPPPPRGPGGGRGGGGRRLLGGVLRHPFLILATVLAVVVAWFLISLFQPFHGAGSGRVVVVVPKGASASEVGDLLSEKGVIDSSTFFQLRATLEGRRSDIYAGRYVLARDMSYGAALDALSHPPRRIVSSMTIPEGYTRPQIAQLASEDGLRGSYMKATVHSRYLNPASYGASHARNLEGFLFPDTFEFKPHAPVGGLVQLQLDDFRRRIKHVDMAYARSKNLTVYDVLTIASMIEHEAGVSSQFPLVAAVIYNRLHEGMPLGIDATIRFATGNYEKPLTESELAIESPYNTRTHQGLPPGPIGNPGMAAIQAAAHPAKKPYLFYVTEPGACGKLAFSKTEAEWQADVERYNSARAAAGGNSPTTCEEE